MVTPQGGGCPGHDSSGVTGAVTRLGVLADLLSKPVLVGNLAGTAGIMIVGQLCRVSRVNVAGESIPDQLRSFAAHVDELHWPTVCLAGGTLAVDTAAATVPVRWFVLNAEANFEVDVTALDAVDQLRAELASRGVVFAIARVEKDLRAALDAAGLTARIGADRLFPTLPTALAAYRHQTGDLGPADR
ncbi:SulP family inorganic anion transporter [Nocardia sp. NPDC046763]|uniref:SulP family inorganic anion transporter n=1 Tax=Nocardia sp. NPDC046763 TaxID=3155256 RepID=UPI0033FEF67D